MAELRSHPYSTRARVALAIARAIAAGRGDADVSEVHVALGLLREGENPAVAALHHGGIPLGVIRGELEAALGPPPGRTRPEEVVLPLTPGERRVVEQAITASRELGDEHLGTQHLLLAILEDAGNLAARAFARHGFDRNAAFTHVDAVVIKHPHSAAPPPSPPAA